MGGNLWSYSKKIVELLFIEELTLQSSTKTFVQRVLFPCTWVEMNFVPKEPQN
jgi:hypothetical protein